MSVDVSERLGGRRLVATIYVAIVAFAALFGAILGVILPARQNVPPTAELGPVEFAITPLNFAVYGAVMLGVSLGVLILVMHLVSERYPEA